MKFSRIKLAALTTLGILMVSACTMAKIEARLEANPQCKDIINPKTGVLMPCPETDKSFYRSVGLEPAKPSLVAPLATATTVNAGSTQTTTQITTVAVSKSSTPTPVTSNTPVTQPDCKPQIHKKTGGLLPCPAAD